jgi:V/A-type H+-transporting ATPase subunit F
MKIAAICDRDTAVGLRLGGVQELFITDENAKEMWNKILERNDIGILFITEKISEDLGKYLKDYRLRNNLPIIVEISDKKGRIKDHIDFISFIIKKAIGIEVIKKR